MEMGHVKRSTGEESVHEVVMLVRKLQDCDTPHLAHVVVVSKGKPRVGDEVLYQWFVDFIENARKSLGD